MGSEKSIEESIDEAEWGWLKPHADRGGLIVVHPEIRLGEAACRIAMDDKETVQKWIEDHKIFKPDQSQIDQWAQVPTKKFLCVIVDPFVLAQEVLLN